MIVSDFTQKIMNFVFCGPFEPAKKSWDSFWAFTGKDMFDIKHHLQKFETLKSLNPLNILKMLKNKITNDVYIYMSFMTTLKDK